MTHYPVGLIVRHFWMIPLSHVTEINILPQQEIHNTTDLLVHGIKIYPQDESSSHEFLIKSHKKHYF